MRVFVLVVALCSPVFADEPRVVYEVGMMAGHLWGQAPSFLGTFRGFQEREFDVGIIDYHFAAAWSGPVSSTFDARIGPFLEVTQVLGYMSGASGVDFGAAAQGTWTLQTGWRIGPRLAYAPPEGTALGQDAIAGGHRLELGIRFDHAVVSLGVDAIVSHASRGAGDSHAFGLAAGATLIGSPGKRVLIAIVVGAALVGIVSAGAAPRT